MIPIRLLSFLLFVLGTFGSFGFDAKEAEAVLKDGLNQGAYPGCTVSIGTSKGVVWRNSFGFLSNTKEKSVEVATIYDLASLTKVVGTTCVAMRLHGMGQLKLDQPVYEICPEFLQGSFDDAAVEQRRKVTIRSLLTHTSGLPSWKPFYKSKDGYKAVLAEVMSLALEAEPGERYKYSDPGMMLMGEVLSRLGGKSLKELERQLVFEPLQMKSTLRNPHSRLKQVIAPTEADGSGGFVHGVVHDENAAAAEGLTGHAGLFSGVEDLSLLAQELLKAWNGNGKIFSKDTIKLFAALKGGEGWGHRGLGWQMADGSTSSGNLFSRESFGHTGFTGTSLWVDPVNDRFVVLLTNRVHPSRKNSKLYKIRERLADAAFIGFQ